MVDSKAHIKAVREQGYTIVPGAIDAEYLTEIKAGLKHIEDVTGPGKDPFSGFKTERSYNLLAKTRVLDRLMIDPNILGIVRGVLGAEIQVSITSVIKILPGETRQFLHRDDGLWPVPRPGIPLVLNTMYALEPFTATNGSTTLIPGSHLHNNEVDQNAEVFSAEMDAGSVLLWDGSLIHGGGANTSDKARPGLNLNYNLGWLKQQENQFIGVPKDEVEKMPEALQRLLGYQITHGIVGRVDTADPLDYFMNNSPE